MTIHQMRTFHVVCRELNYSTAADKCYISRQALRQSIAALENELGGPLFLNHANHIGLTHKGERLQKESAALAMKLIPLTDSLPLYCYGDVKAYAQIRTGKR